MRKLYIGRIDDGFAPADDEVLGAWCFQGREDVHPRWFAHDFITPFLERDVRIRNGHMTAALAEHLVAQNAKKLNARFGVDYDALFWKQVLYNWLFYITQNLWTLYRVVEDFVDREKGDAFVVKGAEDAPPVSDTLALVDDLYNAGPIFVWLASQAVRALAPESWVIEEPDAIPTLRHARRYEPPPISVIRQQLKLSIPGFFARNAIRACLMLAPKRRSRALVFDTGNQVNGFPKAFLQLLSDVLDVTIPSSIEQRFAELDAMSDGVNYRPGRLTLGRYDTLDELTSIVVAKALKHGERFVSVQHGTAYGFSGVMPYVAAMEYQHHAFITWGWMRHGDYGGNFVPLPFPGFARFFGKHHGEGAGIMLVGGCPMATDARIDIFPSYTLYYRQKMEFLSGLSSKIKERFQYRLYPQVYPDAFDEEGSLKTYYPEIEFVCGNLDEAILGCELVIFDHPSTAMHNALVANSPCMLFWNPSWWPLSADKEGDFNTLRQAGILFDTPQDALRHLDVIEGNVAAWWQSDPVQEARRLWLVAHGRADASWFWNWVKAIWRL
ncbi:MAG: hypothetical protein HQL35_01750 [Alphaproteobacteria bacterium]|nr:hypothetical protein [Alphaproteobacteria bacterium]